MIEIPIGGLISLILMSAFVSSGFTLLACGHSCCIEIGKFRQDAIKALMAREDEKLRYEQVLCKIRDSAEQVLRDGKLD